MVKQKKKILFVANPKSGTRTNRQREMVLDLVMMMASSAFEVSMVPTQAAGHATELTAQAVADGVDYVVAVGGDGTVNEVARALVDTPTALGILPLGSGNGLARHLGISMQPEKALQQLFAEQLAVIDTCYLNGTPFFCTAGVGFDAFVAERFAQQTTRGLSTYAKTVLKAWRVYEPPTLSLELDGTLRQQQVFAVTFANASQYGNNAYVAPLALTDDGLMDVCVMSPFALYQLPAVLWRLFNRSLNHSRHLQIFRTPHLCVNTQSSPTLVHLDGDPLWLPTATLQLSLKPHSLRVLVGQRVAEQVQAVYSDADLDS